MYGTLIWKLFGRRRPQLGCHTKPTFLVAHNCSMEFNQQIVQVDRRGLKYTYWHSRLLVSDVHVTQELVIPIKIR